MLIRFKVSNFLSFKEETEFSMVAGNERIHPKHIIQENKKHPKLLRAALLYGANAAGKSNFVKAVDYARWKVLNSGKHIITDRNYYHSDSFFKLDYDVNRSSGFEFKFYTQGKIYLYSFRDAKLAFINEKLVEIENGKEKLLFERNTDLENTTKFSKVDFLEKESDKEFLTFIQRSTNPRKLFLTHCAENNVLWFKKAYDWFQNSLEVIFPDTKDSLLEERVKENNNFRTFFADLIGKAGTGISALSTSTRTRFMSELINDRQGFEETTTFLNLHHGDAQFNKSEESDGTQRLFDLAFPFYDLATSETPKVYIIDELERNLHTNLSYMLLKSYLEQDGKGQLIATTHDTHLLDLDLLRKDEIWFAEKDEHGATQLYSLYDFNPRYDKKIEKEYLTGRFGAIPFLGNIEFKKQLAKNGKSKT